MSAPDKVLVTGATGFIASHLVRALTGRDLEVVGVDLPQQGPHRLCDIADAVTLETLDLRDSAQLQSLFERHAFKAVYHLAAGGVRVEAESYGDMMDVNVLATVRLARLAREHGTGRFVYMGSGFEYEPIDSPANESVPVTPVNFYGATKAAANLMLDELSRMEGLPLTVFRPFSVYGPSESPTRFIPYVIAGALKGEPMELTHCTQVRDYLFVEDVVQALLTVVDNPASPGGVYNLGAGPQGAGPIRTVVETVLHITGASSDLARFGVVQRTRPEPPYFVADISKARTCLGWHPRVTLEDGLARTVDSFKAKQP